MKNKKIKPVSSVVKLREYFKQINTFYNSFDLVQCEPKYVGYKFSDSDYTKGVKSDFIRVFKLDNARNSNSSFAFSFSNPEDSNLTMVTPTFKRDGKVFNGNVFNFIDFRLKLKEFILSLDKLKSINSLDSESVEKMVKLIFQFDIQENISKDHFSDLDEKMVTVKKHLVAKYPDVKSKNELSTSLMNKAVKQIHNFSSKRKKELNIHELEKELKKAYKQLESDIVAKKESLNFTVIENEKRASDTQLRQFNVTLNSKLMNLLSKYPAYLKTEMTKLIKLFQK